MANNNGKWAEEWFEAHWKSFGKTTYLYRFQDHYEVNFGQGVRTAKRRVAPQPSDYLLTHGGTTAFCEVKSSWEKTSFPFGDVQPSQWKAARQQVAAAGEYWFYLLRMHTEQWYRVPAHVMLEVREAGTKSIKWSLLEGYEWIPTVDKPTK